ncbi:choline dehydrogenase [Colletotrichum scovillei]|uniref:GMC oxidoreductase n=1 Tax=Colletotrichum scovillei TaxID=1209932 RepID=A0A9P7U5Y9_9PEZI|nr:choline dehydrogenase [Colletotrichum scovillei]KAF4778910.1 choline dehydrogenase [Colletotrichum scovillei]KAG7038589.1 GMC oxidoreductase [Colletotrichum scovillei]KAG7040768.1 GMC oxidoreductase [Colletotrichum scovillei]KAG7060812.1 GMC oxidoreductase [Colletotrichum scovillei]
MLRTFILSLVSLAAAQDRLFSSAFGYPGRNASYDYIVIGGGTAGLTIASRLAATSASVAVVEAGGFYKVENGNNSIVPLLSLTGIAFIDPSPEFTPQPLMDWSLVSEPIAGAGGRRVHYAQGKTLGGSSAINTMSYIRGTKGSYDLWAETVGDETFRWENMLRFFKRSVDLTPPNEEKRQNTNATVRFDPSDYDKQGGPLQVSWNNWVDPTLTWLAQVVLSLGLSISPKGFSSGKLAGYGAWVPSTIEPENTQRSTSESSFLRQAIKNTEITVYTHTQATKILFDGTKAVGVSVNSQGVEYTLFANEEVILTAGTFHSPQLLQVSGIGPRERLEALSIPVIAHIPGVGQNLQDPIQIFVAYPVSTPSAQSLTNDPALNPGFVEEYLKFGTGPYSSAAGFLAHERLPNSTLANLTQTTRDKLASVPSDWPQLSFIVGSFSTGPGQTSGTLAAYLPLVFSRGNVTISSASIDAKPVINLNWLSDSADVEMAVTAVKRLRTAWASPSANTPGFKTGPELLPGDSVQTDEQILEYVRANVGQVWHPVSTAAMGKEEDVTSGKAVVDSRGRVFGVQGLRVADASTFPFALPGHPQSAVYALVEKIAEDIITGR